MSFLQSWNPCIGEIVEWEQVTDLARRPGPIEKLVVNQPKTRNKSGPNLGQVRELFDKLDKDGKTVGYTRLKKSSKNIKGSLGSNQFARQPDLGSGPKIDTRNSSIP